MKRMLVGIRWYNLILIVGLCIFSLLCWGKFARRISLGLISYNDGFESAWYGSMYQKSYFCKADFIYTYYTTGEIGSNYVIDGKDKWLFYDSSGGSDDGTIADYEGTDIYSSSEMENILNQAKETQDILESKGIQLAILIGTNKENVYYEYMPDKYIHSDIARTDILTQYLSENGVNIINPKQELLEYKDNYQLYYYYDTHWSQLGAYIGVKNVLASWGISVPALSERSVLSYSLAGNYHTSAEDDLAKMVGLRELVYNDDTEYVVDGTGIIDWVQFEDEQTNEKSSYLSYYRNDDAKVEATLLLVGDSFRVAMVPVLTEYFSDVYVIHRGSYSAKLLDELNPDYLISVYVERGSSSISDIKSLVE